MNRDEALQRSEDALKELVEELKNGKSEALVRYLDTLSKFHRYSFGNCMLIALQRPDASLVAGFHRWKQCGRWVKSGAKGIAILAPLVSRKSSQADGDHEGEELSERRSATVRGFRVAYVFDVSDTEGQELPKLGSISGEPGEMVTRIDSLIRSDGIDLLYVNSLGGALGMSEGGKISVLQTLPPAQMFSTLVHELAHERLHRGDRRKDTTKVIRETEAEAVAYVVSKGVGLEPSTHSADYIQLWNGDASLLMQSLELIRDVSARILTALEVDVDQPVANVA